MRNKHKCVIKDYTCLNRKIKELRISIIVRPGVIREERITQMSNQIRRNGCFKYNSHSIQYKDAIGNDIVDIVVQPNDTFKPCEILHADSDVSLFTQLKEFLEFGVVTINGHKFEA